MTTPQEIEAAAPICGQEITNQQFFADNDGLMWIAVGGSVELFAVLDSGLRRHVFEVDRGSAIFGIAPNKERHIRLLAVPSADSIIRCLPASSCADPELLGKWVDKLAAVSGTSLQAMDSGLQFFHNAVLASIERQICANENSNRDRLHAKAVSSSAAMRVALSELAAPLAGSPLPVVPQTDARSRLLQACRAIATSMGVSSNHAELCPLAETPADDGIEAIARSLGLRARKVSLGSSWWKRDAGPMLAYRKNSPVALLPDSKRRYRLFDPSTGCTTRLNAGVATELDPNAFSFYRPLPGDSITPLGLLSFGLRECRSDLLTIAFMGLATGLLGLAFPAITARFVGYVIPGAVREDVITLAVLLAACAAASALFSYVSTIALQRVGGRMGGAIQYALWERLLALPSPFFARFSAAELASRTATIDYVRQIITGPLIAGALGCPFGVIQVLLLFYYSPAMAAPALALPALLIGVSAVCTRLLARRHRATAVLEGLLSAKVFQFVSGIAKIRVAGAESRAFASWARLFARLKLECIGSRNVSAAMAGIHAAVPFIGWAMVVWFSDVNLTNAQRTVGVGELIAFSIAFQQVLASAIQFSTVMSSVAQISPLIERVRPILDATPESASAGVDPGMVSGAIHVEKLTFHYSPERPLFRELSLKIEPGEFVAIIGSSGCGKSTLLRLLLGFEQPCGGSILYDGKDIGKLDLQALRRQMGVVLQNGRILDGDIAANILGTSTLSLEAAWEAARLAGLDADIQAMPMKMHTRLTEGGGGISGGQRQRILIARALVNKPRIVLFDEATSALDNRTQAIVSAGLESLKATRVVIAHRLSTIRNADRILVLDHGAIAEQGTYDELMQRGGIFAEMAKRQIA